MANQLSAIKHVVQLMLENRSFDQMLGFLYARNNNKSPTNQPYEGLTGDESNPDDPAPQAIPTNKGFVINFNAAIASDRAKHFKDSLPDTISSEIMGMYTPE